MSTRPRSILVVEDDRVLNRLLVKELDRVGFAAVGVTSWAAAEDYLAEHEPALVVLDDRLPDRNGLDLLGELAASLPVVVLTAYGSVAKAVQAMKLGASDYLTKPVDPEELELTISRTLEQRDLAREVAFLRARLSGSRDREILGNSAPAQQLRALIDAVAPSDATVLIEGESGVGKELAAFAIHTLSNRASRNFITIDCCTLNEQSIETELFGHEKGAFPGADRMRRGLIEEADSGTAFFDEIGELGLGIQAKLLRVLETGAFRRLGGTKDLVADVRIIAATKRDLTEAASAGTFRPDLFYRLNVVRIEVPPLRERRSDISLLAQHFLARTDPAAGPRKRLSTAARNALLGYGWPGNVRELRNVVERAIVVSAASPVIEPAHLGLLPANGERPALSIEDLTDEPTLNQLEGRYLKALLERYQGRRGKVATILGISERNIYRLIKKHSLDEQE